MAANRSSSTPHSEEAWTQDWNSMEKRILRMWIDSGMTLAEAEKTLLGDLADAAEEDGYDGP